MRWRRVVAVGLLTTVLLGGCWNRREPELLALITLVSFDYDDERDRYTIEVVIVNPLGAQGGANDGGGNTSQSFWVVRGSGLTPFGTLRSLEEETTRELYWAHARVILIGEALARRGIDELLEFFERERQFRPTALLAVVDGPTRQLLAQEYPLEEDPGEGLDRQLLITSLNRGIIPLVTLREASMTLARPGLELILPRIEARPSQAGLDALNPARVSGSAAFSGSRMAGWLSADETRGWEVIMGELRRSTLELELEEPGTGRVAVELFTAQTTVAPRVSGDRVAIDVDIRAGGRVQSHASELDLRLQGAETTTLRRQVENEVRQLVDSSITRAKLLGSDVFGFGELIYRTHPRTWERMKSGWPERFAELEVNVNVQATVTRTGLVVEPVRSR